MVSPPDPSEDAAAMVGDLAQISLALLSDWCVYLTDVAAPREGWWARSSNHDDEDRQGTDEALGDFIDKMYHLRSRSFIDDPDEELAQALALLVEVDHLLLLIAGDREAAIVRDTFSAAMMNLAAIMRGRGFSTRLPRVRLR